MDVTAELRGLEQTENREKPSEVQVQSLMYSPGQSSRPVSESRKHMKIVEKG